MCLPWDHVGKAERVLDERIGHVLGAWRTRDAFIRVERLLLLVVVLSGRRAIPAVSCCPSCVILGGWLARLRIEVGGVELPSACAP